MSRRLPTRRFQSSLRALLATDVGAPVKRRCKRRFQFSLRTLLRLVALVCLFLGGWHLLVRYGQFVEAVPSKTKFPWVRGRFILFSMERQHLYRATFLREGMPIQTFDFVAESNLPFVYNFKLYGAKDGPGAYAVEAHLTKYPDRSTSCTNVLPLDH